jgi:phosphomannomutase
MIIPSHILRLYDIRGRVPYELTPDIARTLGYSFAQSIATHTGRSSLRIVLGYDGRLSSPALAQAAAEGMSQAGSDVIWVGLVPTPMVYFGVNHIQAEAGMMITGSHNPADFNGFKLLSHTGPFWNEQIRNLPQFSTEPPFADPGKITENSLLAPYLECITETLPQTAPKLKLAWDPGHGAVAAVLSELLRHIPAEHICINNAVDGTFPAHHPDPTVPENLEQLREVVLSHDCHLGIAFDGDGDRLGVIDRDGTVLWGDQLLGLFAADVLSRHPGATIIGDVKVSETIFEFIRHSGGVPYLSPTGHSIIKSKLRETGALLAGEMSGHMFFADEYAGYDDALYAAVRLCRLLLQDPEALSKYRAQLPKTYTTPELRIQCDDTLKLKVITAISAALKAQGQTFDDLDGVRVRNHHGWWLLRASNTQDALVARCESTTAAGLSALIQELTSILNLCHIDCADLHSQLLKAS